MSPRQPLWSGGGWRGSGSVCGATDHQALRTAAAAGGDVAPLRRVGGRRGGHTGTRGRTEGRVGHASGGCGGGRGARAGAHAATRLQPPRPQRWAVLRRTWQPPPPPRPPPPAHPPPTL